MKQKSQLPSRINYWLISGYILQVSYRMGSYTILALRGSYTILAPKGQYSIGAHPVTITCSQAKVCRIVIASEKVLSHHTFTLKLSYSTKLKLPQKVKNTPDWYGLPLLPQPMLQMQSRSCTHWCFDALQCKVQTHPPVIHLKDTHTNRSTCGGQNFEHVELSRVMSKFQVLSIL